MGGDPEQPGGELGGRLIRTPRTIHAQENLLRQLFGYGVVLHHPVEEVNDGGAMFFEQNTKARIVSRFHPEHQFRVKIQSRRSRAYTRLNPFGHARLLSVPKYLLPAYY